MAKETLKTRLVNRNLTNVPFVIEREGNQDFLSFPVSSEAEIMEDFGAVVSLLHEQSAIRTQRANSGAMPFLFMHDEKDPIGIISRFWVKEDRRGWVKAALFNTPMAVERKAMIDQGMRNVSLRAMIYRVQKIESNGRDVLRAVDWEPYEVSLVTVPADFTVGIGRSASGEVETEIESAQTAEKGGNMSKEKEAAATAVAENKEEKGAEAAVNVTRSAGGNGAGATPAVLELEQQRVKALKNLAKANSIGEPVLNAWVSRGTSLADASEDILRILEERGKSDPQPATRIGMSPGETQRFSLRRAILACATRDWTKAAFEAECSRAVSNKLGRVVDENHFLVPFEVLERPVQVKRDLTVATAGAGGFLVETENVGFIEMLRNRSVAFQMGARRLSGLVGSVTVPRQSAAGTAVWLANEAATITESQQTFVQMALTPKNVGAYTEISRQLLLQSSPGAEGIVSDDLAQVVAIAADLAVLAGTAAGGQPQGIIGTSGVGSVTGTSFDFADILEFQTDVLAANVRPIAGGYVTTPTVASLCIQRVKYTSTASPLWEGSVSDGTMQGYRAMSSNQVPAGDMIFGDWQEVVVGEWGTLEVEVNPYANFQAGIIGVRAIYSMDVGVRRPFAFSVMTSAT